MPSYDAEYQKPPRSKSHKGTNPDDIKELQVRVKLDHPVLEQDHWSRLCDDMRKVNMSTSSRSDKQLSNDIGLDQSRMLVIQAALLCTSFMLHFSDIHDGGDLGWIPLNFPRHACEKDLCIDIRSLTHVISALVSHVS